MAQVEVEDLMEEILDMEAEHGALDPLTSRFVSVLAKVQEESAIMVLKEARNKLKERFCAMLDGSPELHVAEGSLRQLENLVARKMAYQGTLDAEQLIGGGAELRMIVDDLAEQVEEQEDAEEEARQAPRRQAAGRLPPAPEVAAAQVRMADFFAQQALAAAMPGAMNWGAAHPVPRG